MNNYDRIYSEISRETATLGRVNDMDPELLLDLVMEIVDLVDRDQTKRVPKINQQIQDNILLFAQNKLRDEEAS